MAVCYLLLQKTDREMAEESGSKKKAESLMKSTISKEAKMIPTLVFKIEQFENDLIKITARCKHDFKLRISVARDFRVLQNELQRVRKRHFLL